MWEFGSVVCRWGTSGSTQSEVYSARVSSATTVIRFITGRKKDDLIRSLCITSRKQRRGKKDRLLHISPLFGSSITFSCAFLPFFYLLRWLRKGVGSIFFLEIARLSYILIQGDWLDVLFCWIAFPLTFSSAMIMKSTLLVQIREIIETWLRGWWSWVSRQWFIVELGGWNLVGRLPGTEASWHCSSVAFKTKHSMRVSKHCTRGGGRGCIDRYLLRRK